MPPRSSWRQGNDKPNLAVGAAVMLFLQTISAARILAYPSPTTALDLDTLPVITAAPSPDLVNGRLEKRTAIVNSCATACIASAVTKSTECKLGDTACECQPLNANAILLGAFNCIEAACGAFVAQAAISAANAICTSVANEDAFSSSSAAPSHSGGGLDGNTSSRGSWSGSSGSGSSGNSNSVGSRSSSSSSSNGLSSGAIAGVAIGAAAVVVIACALLYYFWIQGKRHGEITNANVASQIPAGNGPPPMSSTVPVQDGTGKPPAPVATSTTPVGAHHYPSSLPGTSPYSSAMNTGSPISHGSLPVYPGTTELAGDGWQQQQQANSNSPSEGVGAHGPPNYPPGFHQVHGQAIPPLQPQEMFSDPHNRNELHQPDSDGVYEMYAKPGG